MRHSAMQLRSFPVFEAITAQGSLTKFRTRQAVFLQGSYGNTIFYLHRGTIKLSVTSEQGKEIIIEVLGPGEFFGEDALISDGCPRSYSAICLSESQVVKIDCAQVVETLRAGGNLSHAFIGYVLRRNRELRDHLANYLLYPAAQRLRRALVSVACHRRPGLDQKMSQQTLAEMIGTTRQYVNVLLKEFRRSKLCEESVDSSMAQFLDTSETVLENAKTRKVSG